jgi:hypothetical protein
MDESPLARRVLQLEVAAATAASDMRNHIKLCDARWNVIWKLAGMVAGVIALGVTLATNWFQR